MTSHRALPLLLALAAAPASAATYDPSLTWRTLRTEHFDIHFHQGEEQLASELVPIAEHAWDTLTAEMMWRPRLRVQVVLVDSSDSANGWASTLPQPTITLLATAPGSGSSLELYEDWLETVFTHELTHILHIETHHGVVRLARGTVGRVASTNRVSPSWMVEGYATFQETNHTSGGRGRAPMAQMVLRAAVVDDAFPPLGNLDGYQADPPAGNLRYLFGESLMRHVAEAQGEQVWTRWVHGYGSSIPFILPGRRLLGRPLPALYADWRAEMEAEVAAQLEPVVAEGLIEGRVVSDGVASCLAPAFSPDGARLLWSCADRRTGSAIWLADGAGEAPEKLLQDRGASNITWRADSQAFVYSGTHIVNRFNVWSDVYLHELGKDTPTALTQGKRAKDPDFSPDGSRLVVVTNRAQDNQLEVLTVDRRQEALTAHTDHTQLDRPRFAPDGRSLAVSVWRDGRRDLWLYDTEGRPLRRLTADVAPDRDPAWAADGRYLYFSSDRSGIPNIYAIEIASERLWQVTNVRTAAAMPSVSPDGKRLAYAHYSADGWDVAVLDLDPTRFLDRGMLPGDPTSSRRLVDLVGPPATASATLAVQFEGAPIGRSRPGEAPWQGEWSQDAGGIQSYDQTDVRDAFGEEKVYDFPVPPTRYNPIPRLAPRWYVPYFQLSPFPSTGPFAFLGSRAAVVNASTAISDPLRHHGYRADLSYRTDVNFLGGGFAYTLNRYLPVATASVQRAAIYRGGVPLENPEGGDPLRRCTADQGWEDCYWERRVQGALAVSYPYSPRTTVFGGWQLSSRESLLPLPDDALLDRVPVRGRLGQLSAGWRYAWSQPNPYSISPEDARVFSLVGSVLHPALGTRVVNANGEEVGLTQVQLTTELREYVVNPWVPNHVLAFRAAAGLSAGDAASLGRYQLGGSLGDSGFYATPEGVRPLRGHPVSADLGDLFWLSSVEYRLPFHRIDRGLGVYPAFARALSGAAFVDAGNAFELPATWQGASEGVLLGVGVEATLSGVVGWGTPVTGTIGWAQGFQGGVGARATASPLDNMYFRIGGAF